MPAHIKEKPPFNIGSIKPNGGAIELISCLANHGSSLSGGPKVSKFATHISHLENRRSMKYDLDWPSGGAIGTILIS